MAFKTKDTAEFGRVGVYIIKAPDSWNCYVGSSKACDSRISKHFYMLRRGTHPNHILTRAYKKYGESLNAYIVEEVKPSRWLRDPAILTDIEDDWMDRLPSVYNISNVAHSPAADPRVRARISRALSGRKMSKERLEIHKEAMRRPDVNDKRRRKMKNRPLSDTSRKKHRKMVDSLWWRRRVSLGLRRNKKEVSEDTRSKISDALTGRKLSDSHRANIGTGHTGLVKLPRKHVVEIRKRHDPSRATASYKDLAKQFGVSWLTVFKVVKRVGSYAA